MKRGGKRDEKTRQCTATLSDGGRCSSWARRDSDPALCSLHALSPEARKAQSRRAASASAIKRRSNAEGKNDNGLDPGIPLEDVLSIVADALESTLEFPAGAEDWGARLTACGVLLAAFPQRYRSSPVRVRELLEELLPEHVYDPERMEAQAVYSSLRREHDRLPSWHPLRGLFVKPYPAYMIAAWEDYDDVCRRELPADIPLDRAPVRRLDDGRVILARDGELPLLLELEHEAADAIARGEPLIPDEPAEPDDALY